MEKKNINNEIKQDRGIEKKMPATQKDSKKMTEGISPGYKEKWCFYK